MSPGQTQSPYHNQPRVANTPPANTLTLRSSKEHTHTQTPNLDKYSDVYVQIKHALGPAL